MINQHTLKKSASITGIGVHSGAPVQLTLHPAPENTGIIFRCKNSEIPAKLDFIGNTDACTCLEKDGARIATVEHLLSACAALGIDNVYAELTLPELPILDGSAYPFIELIQNTGILEQNAPRQFLKIKKSVEVVVGDKFARLEPFDGFRVSMEINFNHPVIAQSQQKIMFDFSKEKYIEEISRARTFGFLKDYEMLKAKNLAGGSSLENTVVLDDAKVINENGLRYPDEFVKHKILDAIGDLYLLGSPILGAFSGFKSGHSLNAQLMKKLTSDQSAWELTHGS